MKTMVIYLIETLACSGILLAAYAILLERRVAFRWCRSYLLLSMPLAAVIPLLRIPVWPGKVVLATTAVAAAEPAWDGRIIVEAPAVSPETVCMLIWLLGTAFLAALMCWQAVRIRRLRRNAEITRTEQFTLVRTRAKIASFSFFRSVYVWAQTPADQMQAILLHEASHIGHRHSCERIAMESVKALLWWNPFVWIAARRLTEVEEFEADHDVLAGGYDMEHYMNAIFRQLFGHSPDIANGLRDSLTKKRFKMMTTQTPSRHALLRLAGTLPVVAGLLCAFSFTTRAAVLRTPEPAPADRAVAVAGHETHEPADRSERTGAMKGNDSAKRLTSEAVFTDDSAIRESASADANGVQLTITLMDKDGKGFSSRNYAQGATVQVIGSNKGTVADSKGHAALDVAAGAVLEIKYPGYEPAAVAVNDRKKYFVILRPEGTASAEAPIYSVDEDGVKQKPLYIVDGVEYPFEPDLNANRIAGITILKGDQAEALYGERGRNGVVAITTETGKARQAKSDDATAEEAKSDNADSDEPFLISETMPLFQGGVNAFRMWVQQQVRYPAEAMQKNIQGRVVVSFVIEKDGSVSDIRMLQSPDKILSDEARRVIASSPAWTPGKQRGKVVRVRYTMPVDFRVLGADPPAKQSPTAEKSATTADEIVVVNFGPNK